MPRVRTPQGVVEFPDGMSEQDMAAALSQLPKPAASHAEAPKRPEEILAASDENYIPDTTGLGERALERTPAIGAGIAAYLSGGSSIPLTALAAGGGGMAGSLLRGDSLRDSAIEGGKQGAMELVGGGLVKGGRWAAREMMRGTVPKNIATNFDDVDIAGNMLDRGVVPGSARSASRVSRLSSAANVERDAAATTVPMMPRSKIVEGLRPTHQKMVAAHEPELAGDVVEHMRESARNVGRNGLTGAEALARKDVKQALGKAATTSANPRQAALGPQLQDAERAAIVSHLRETPRMGAALDESQTMMAIDKVMQDAKHSNPVTRMRVGGLAAGAMSPIGLSTTAHGINQGRKVLSPQALRLLDMIMNGGGE